MSQLFRRNIRIVAAPKPAGVTGALLPAFDLSNVDASFRVKKTLKPEPNTAELEVYNLAPATRAALTDAKTILLQIYAGLGTASSMIFQGEVQSATSSQKGSDVVTKIESDDAIKHINTAFVSLSIAPQMPVSAVLLHLAEQLGVGPGNTSVVAARLAAQGHNLYGPGTVIFGYAADELSRFCRSVNYEWSIQDGQLQLLPRGSALEALATLLTPDTGLLGSPTIDNDGRVECVAAIQPDLVPGKRVFLQSVAFSGQFRIHDAEYVGETRGDSWQVTMHSKDKKKKA